MLQNIIDLLKYSKGETENIRLAKGKYKFPNSVGEAYKQFRHELRWQKKG